ncbi:ATP synthase F0F1 subunit gamma [Metamycoplasma cloacale]|uniref:ATP synthase gamma chain n=1 Tax=Metamycoplasma cloacale TaxID=92401 RepID=A0A2Z4LLT3_9BACT|nr:ATP synthase F1 subunit gamma [Metamycoplasma cloacale]AWX42685.1 ATP synthase F1 subunit gamma [Metamycoplasma cloacale]VEU79503.1 ATP synthase F0F1 subunit gamma [Metamycoplasma cloacale]
MESLQKIKHRISSVNSTKKITKAMELVATAKFAKVKRQFNEMNDYFHSVEKLFLNLIQHSEQNIDELLNTHALAFAQKRNLYIVFGSDLGLCGSYNSNMIKKINEVVTDDDILIVIGSKLLTLLNKRPNTHIIQTLTQIGDSPDYEIAKIISSKIYDVLQISLLKSVKLIYTKYINPITADPVVREIFPISIDTLEREKSTNNENNQTKFMQSLETTFEPNADKILESSFVIFFEAMIYHALFNAKLSEMSLRRTAMEQASDNAEELIDDLQIKYNSSRQAKITQEITEIVGGSNS